MKIEDLTGNYSGAVHVRRSLEEIRGIMIHRVGKDLETGADFGDSAEDICRAFTEGPAASYTGYKVPYSFIVEKGGRIAQVLPLAWVGPHALGLSRSWLGVALIGDFRHEEATPEQLAAARFLVRSLLDHLALPAYQVKGHTHPDMLARGSTKDLNKECPGPLLDVAALAGTEPFA